MDILYLQQIGRAKRNNDGLRDYQREALKKMQEELFRNEKDITDQVEIVEERAGTKLLSATVDEMEIENESV